MAKSIIYNAEQLFSNLNEQNKTVDFTIPQHILKKLEIKKGDRVRVQVLKNGDLLISKEQNGQ